MFRRFFNDTSGATAIEYGLIGAIMFLACIAAFYSFGSSASGMFNHIVTTISAAIGS